MRTWENGSKSDLPAGPWSEEPDKGHWVDEKTGLDCLIVRGSLGGLCGYVGVPPGHPWHGVGYNDVIPALENSPEGLIDVHGGLTFSGPCSESVSESEGVCHVPEPGRPSEVHWFGFDCCHLWDLVPGMEDHFSYHSNGRRAVYRDWDYVRREVESMSRQLGEISA